MPDDTSGIHYSDPFATPEADREPIRRFRGRLAAGVTVWTAATAEGGPAGLTVSSMLVAEGDPSLAVGIAGTTSSLLEAIVSSERFVVHVLDAADKRTADIFAGLFPSPGGFFAERKWEMGDYGPVLAGSTNRVYCRLVSVMDAGYQRLVTGTIDRVELDDLSEPLVYFRGKYRSLAETRDRT